MRAGLPEAWGNFLATLAPWSWFVTITFRDPPNPLEAIKLIEEWLADIQAQAGGKPIGWIIAEEFGRAGGRYHCHLLISGVSHLWRRWWWDEAFRRFGRSRIEPFDPEKAAAFYAAKYAAKALGGIHPGGALAGHELQFLTHSPDGRRMWGDTQSESSAPVATHAIAAPSANVEKSFFRISLGRWHR